MYRVIPVNHTKYGCCRQRPYLQKPGFKSSGVADRSQSDGVRAWRTDRDPLWWERSMIAFEFTSPVGRVTSRSDVLSGVPPRDGPVGSC